VAHAAFGLGNTANAHRLMSGIALRRDQLIDSSLRTVDMIAGRIGV
jgi:hypothetical protein